MSFAIPNGGSRNLITGKRLKMEGVTRGVPDCMIAIPTMHQGLLGKKYRGGLFIEFKVGSNRPTKEQAEFILRLRAKGYEATVCYTLEEAQAVVKKYLGDMNGY